MLVKIRLAPGLLTALSAGNAVSFQLDGTVCGRLGGPSDQIDRGAQVRTINIQIDCGRNVTIRMLGQKYVIAHSKRRVC